MNLTLINGWYHIGIESLSISISLSLSLSLSLSFHPCNFFTYISNTLYYVVQHHGLREYIDEWSFYAVVGGGWWRSSAAGGSWQWLLAVGVEVPMKGEIAWWPLMLSSGVLGCLPFVLCSV
eukprot:GHVN01080188.1.p1 GENE.GHVN01080188.1~~GHVN01080188.1.p1  ORF type:complete len:121 (+),score=14.94 GHVN01080188.1:122-484(+)